MCTMGHKWGQLDRLESRKAYRITHFYLTLESLSTHIQSQTLELLGVPETAFSG